MPTMSIKEANEKYRKLCTALNNGEGESGLENWARVNYRSTVNSFQRSQILGANLSHHPESFNEYMAHFDSHLPF